MKLSAILAVLLLAAYSTVAALQSLNAASDRHGRAIRALLIVAHPDDEYEMAGTVYRIAKELDGTVDQIIVTDGQGGFRYSSLAARYYGLNLTDEATGRANLPRIREEEARQAAKILGIRHQWFLGERDDHFTVDVKEALATWNVQRISNKLSDALQKGRYDYVFVLLPTEDDHGEHKAATILALRRVEALPESSRPVVIAAQAGPQPTATYTQLSGFPITATTTSDALFHFDRSVHFGFNDSLSYEIVVDWVIAEHKSQGLFQTKAGQDRYENFWIFADGDKTAVTRAEDLFKEVTVASKFSDVKADGGK